MVESPQPRYPFRRRVGRTALRIVHQATAASIATSDITDAIAPGTLPAVTTGRRGPGRRGGPGGGDRASRWAGPGYGRRRRPRRRSPVPLVLVLIGLLITGFGFQRVTGIRLLPDALTASSQPPPRRFPVLEPSQPVEISIRTLRLRAAVHTVGLAPDGTIAVPPPERYNEVGWYDQSPTPGQYGPAILVGHVDTRNGPAVFHRLQEIRPGARVEVERQDGSVAIFEVNSVRRFAKAHQPVDRIYDDFSRPGLRLMTCGGRWVGGSTGYADNVVVFASLVASRSAD